MADSSAQGGQIKELKVSGHTMTLDPGLYCVFNAPDSVVASRGLPGVRISIAPSRQMNASIATFNADGWIGADEGALVRVAEGTAEVMVTVYQAPGSKAEAPKLQVVRLSAEPGGAVPAAPAAVAAPVKAVSRRVDAPEGVEVMAHIYSRGDVGAALGGWMGEPGSQRWIEGFGIAPTGGVPMEDIEYQAVLGRGWLSPWSEGGQFCGSRGMSLPILGMRVRLRGKSAETHRVVLSASFVDGTKIGPVGDGDACEAPSLAALEAFQIAFEPIDAGVAARPVGARAAGVKAAGAKAGGAKAGGAKVAAPVKAAEVARGKPGRGKAVAAPASPAPVPAPAPVVKGKGKAKAAPVAPEPPAPAARRKAPAPARRR